MTNKSQKLNSKRANQMRRREENEKSPVAKKDHPKNKGSWLASLLAFMVLLGGGTLVIGGAWLSIQLILNPDGVNWLNQYLPEWAQIPVGNRKPPQTLTQIQNSLSQEGLIAGDTLPLDDEEKLFILPVKKQLSICSADCEYIVELRVYELAPGLQLKVGAEKRYHLLNQLAIQGPEESFVIAPVVNADSDSQGSSIPLPLTEVGRFEVQPSSEGIWFYLRGNRQQGTNAIAYGHIIHYNPEQAHLQNMLSWTSPAGELPTWRQITGSNTPELIINQTVGLEPLFRVYQVAKVEFFLNPTQLEAISLSPPALDNSDYQDALLLARSGLWTPARKLLQTLQKQRQKPLPAAAAAQIDLIRLHSDFTQNQANTNWANVSQEVLAELIDGRWEEGLKVYVASPENTQEVATLLEADNGRLRNRIETALRVQPNNQEVQAWNALIMSIKQGRNQTEDWLKEQSKKTKTNLPYIQKLLRRLDGDYSDGTTPTNHTSRIVGSAQPVTQINPKEWLPFNPKIPLQVTQNEVWYQVEVSAFNDGRGWLLTPFTSIQLPKTEPEKFIWQQLGLNNESAMQITVWTADGQQQTTNVTIKGVQLRGGVLRLLASATEMLQQRSSSPNQPPPLALTDAALEWVQPSPITLEEVYQQQPQQVQAMLPRLWRELQTVGAIKGTVSPSFEQLRQQMGAWPVQVIDLTGDDKPEVVLNISPETIATLNQTKGKTPNPQSNNSRARTLVFADTGKIIYNGFRISSQPSLTAIASLESGQPPALLVEDSKTYGFQRWNSKTQRFE
ncbi:MAG: hypothetical protein VKL59_18370 [Nostocaceae cyanobacterium]|nr:hypothetical protein [Nostocaceae cyanobacterium]